ncbi:MAG: hypothetical protein D6798_04900 [Deltaproteobacteria bacterium]|nr:MAG: hypothetical protein D6798_04900 [Deltaproteobacteria bacterium]
MSYFPVEAHLHRGAVARRRRQRDIRRAAALFGGGRPGGGFASSSWGQDGVASWPPTGQGLDAPAKADDGPFEPRTDYDTWTESGGEREPDTGDGRPDPGLFHGSYTPVITAPEDMTTTCVDCERGTEGCHRNIKGDDATCAELAPVDAPASLDDFVSASSADAAGRVDIDPDFSAVETDLLLKAWAILVQNTDLVKWAVCWITGNPGAGDCMVDRILGKGYKVSIQAKEGAGAFHTGWFRKIQIFVEGEHWADYVDIWSCGAGASAEENCSAVDLSATLLHEITHVCNRAWWDDEGAGKCYTSYLIENAYRWAVFHRYRDLAGSGCCADSKKDRVFGSSASEYPSDSCLPCTSSSGSTGADGALPSGLTFESTDGSLTPTVDWPGWDSTLEGMG